MSILSKIKRQSTRIVFLRLVIAGVTICYFTIIGILIYQGTELLAALSSLQYMFYVIAIGTVIDQISGSISSPGNLIESAKRMFTKTEKPPSSVSETNSIENSTVEVAKKYFNDIAAAARSKYEGIKEVAGKGDNPIIVGWFKEVGWDRAYKYVHDSVYWCALLIAVICKRNNLQMVKPNAKSALSIGKKLTLKEATEILKSGHNKPFIIVAVFHRGIPGSDSGHIVLVLDIIGEKFNALSGNDSDEVLHRRYDINQSDFISFVLLESIL